MDNQFSSTIINTEVNINITVTRPDKIFSMSQKVKYLIEKNSSVQFKIACSICWANALLQCTVKLSIADKKAYYRPQWRLLNSATVTCKVAQ